MVNIFDYTVTNEITWFYLNFYLERMFSNLNNYKNIFPMGFNFET